MKKLLNLLLIIFLFGLLISVRAFIEPFFYDPFILYFKNDYLHKSIPTLNIPNYFLHVFCRYVVNTLISLSIIFVIFKNRLNVVFALKFYALALIFLSLSLFLILKLEVFQNTLALFYVRRFLIQPLFIFILIPAFFYQNLLNSDK
ncbi:exosortase F system-associated protein [Lutibacter sp.]|uniref:exosortase F system-associated membrane protein n=1 Tax=Lutibacter sp. TaxID=1925666 RepID=UPI0035256D29